MESKGKSNLFDDAEYQRWSLQAEHTLNSARKDLLAGDFGWACFKAQQAAELAMKGLLRGMGLLAFGHSVLKLLEQLESAGIPTGSPLKAAARTLDAHYIPPRYPDAYAEGSPFQFYDADAARRALKACDKIMRMVREQKDRWKTS